MNEPHNSHNSGETRCASDGAEVPSGARHAAPLPEGEVTAKQTVAVRAALLALAFYKVNLSVLFAGSCRFEPTCSRYMYEAVARFGVMRGVWLGTKRLLRCHPLSKRFGHDPVPETWEEMPSNSNTGAVRTEVHG